MEFHLLVLKVVVWRSGLTLVDLSRERFLFRYLRIRICWRNTLIMVGDSSVHPLKIGAELGVFRD